jgi:hypothetical protein
MFKIQMMGWIFVWAFVVFAFLGFLHISSPRAVKAYHRLVDHAKKDNGEFLQEEARSKRQARTEVSKQIIFQKGSERLESRLESLSSDLTYSKEEGELIEHFKDITCNIQEEIHSLEQNETNQDPLGLSFFDVDQVIKRFKAKEAVYSYKTGQLKAKEVEVFQYLLPGRQLPLSVEELHPIFQGKARSISLSLFEKSSLKAEGFQAIFQDRKAIQ